MCPGISVRRYLLSLLFLSLLGGAVGVTPVRADDAACAIPHIKLAHCTNTLRNFKTLILAVHGWGGSCETTFGERERSLFRVLAKDQFFDIDCFSYQSFTTSVDDAALALRRRLKKLSDFGYTRVLFVTHSLGGVVVLRAYTDLYLDGSNELRTGQAAPDVQLPDSFRLVGLNAWAAPITGLRNHVLVGGEIVKWLPVVRRFVNLFTDSPFGTETIEDLAPNSAVLTRLRERLVILGRHHRNPAAVPVAKRDNLKFSARYFQGQGDDWVVHRIIEGPARDLGWFWANSRLTDTDEGHTNNVSDPGSLGSPHYPTEIVRLVALLRLGSAPRYDEVFPTDLAARGITYPPRDLVNRQLKVVKGLNYLAQENMLLAFGDAVEFLRYIFTTATPRSADVDRALVDGLLTTIRNSPFNSELRDFFCRLMTEVFADYRLGDDAESFGGGFAEPQLLVLELVESIWRRIGEFRASMGEDEADVASYCPSADPFAVAVILRFLSASHDDVWKEGLRFLAQNVHRLSDGVVTQSNFVERLNQYYTASYDHIDKVSKKHVVAIYSDILQRNPSIATRAYATLSAPVAWQQAERPLVATLNDDQLAQRLAFGVLSTAPDEAESTRLVGRLAEQGGATGTDTKFARIGVEAVAFIGSRSMQQAVVARETLSSIARNSEFPAISGLASRRLSAMGQ